MRDEDQKNTTTKFRLGSKLIASGSRDKTIKLWDVATGQCRQTLEGHSDRVFSVTFSHDSKLIASGSTDKSIKLYDVVIGMILNCQKG